MSFFSRLMGGGSGGHGVGELARRLDVPEDALQNLRPSYQEFSIPKRAGGMRRIHAPDPHLKALQRRILRRLLQRLPLHPCATGFRKGHSIASHAAFHAGKAVVVHMDVRDFFPTTHAKRVDAYFRKIGWSKEAARLLVRLCTHEKALPQGAPTSPCLSNLLNYGLDARMAGLAAKHSGAYSRYADDLSFSFAEDTPQEYRAVIRGAKNILRDYGYRHHTKKKLHIRRRHERQIVTGLVVNEGVALPRETRRWLRAVEHRMMTQGEATLTPEQLAGWHALEAMISYQRGDGR